MLKGRFLFLACWKIWDFFQGGVVGVGWGGGGTLEETMHDLYYPLRGIEWYLGGGTRRNNSPLPPWKFWIFFLKYFLKYAE